MSYINPQVQRAANDLSYESDACEQCQGTKRIGSNPPRPCICMDGYLWYPKRGEDAIRERPINSGKTDKELLELWAQKQAGPH
jgi:hypothetical protein